MLIFGGTERLACSVLQEFSQSLYGGRLMYEAFLKPVAKNCLSLMADVDRCAHALPAMSLPWCQTHTSILLVMQSLLCMPVKFYLQPFLACSCLPRST